MSDFYDLENPETFGNRNRFFFRGSGTERFKNCKTGMVPEKLGRMGSLCVGKSVRRNIHVVGCVSWLARSVFFVFVCCVGAEK